MGEQLQRGALVARRMEIASGYSTPAVGDSVKVSGENEVDLVGDEEHCIGTVLAINTAGGNVLATVTVELRGAAVRNGVASGTVTVGDRVQSAAAQELKTWAPGAGLSALIRGTALTGAANPNSFDYLED